MAHQSKNYHFGALSIVIKNKKIPGRGFFEDRAWYPLAMVFRM